MDKPRNQATNDDFSSANDLREGAGSSGAQGNLTPVSVEGVSYLSGDQALLDDVTFIIPAATKTVIMGANGAGKSLLLRILHGLLEPTHGAIYWNGVIANGAIERRQAMVFQRPVLLRRSAASNISFVLRHVAHSWRQAEVRRILEDANLGHRSETPARLLSGGEQQRLAIARAMANGPDILFLDEPTAGLDPASIFAVEEMILKASAKGTKVVLVTHDLGQARRIADDVVFLDCGRVVETAAAGDFFSQPQAPAAKAYLSGELFLQGNEKPVIDRRR